MTDKLPEKRDEAQANEAAKSKTESKPERLFREWSNWFGLAFAAIGVVYGVILGRDIPTAVWLIAGGLMGLSEGLRLMRGASK